MHSIYLHLILPRRKTPQRTLALPLKLTASDGPIDNHHATPLMEGGGRALAVVDFAGGDKSSG